MKNQFISRCLLYGCVLVGFLFGFTQKATAQNCTGFALDIRTVDSIACYGETYHGSMVWAYSSGASFPTNPVLSCAWSGFANPVSFQTLPGALSAGTYSVTVTETATGCTAATTVQVLQPALLVSQMPDTVQVPCYGNGVTLLPLAVGGTAPYRLYIGNSLGTGIYYCNWGPTSFPSFIVDAHGCRVTINTIITQPQPLVFSLVGTQNTTCVGCCDGGISTTTTGGTLPYTYDWGVAAVGSPANLCTGTYTATLTDANGCTSSTITAEIANTMDLVVNISTITSQHCYGGHDGSATAIITGGIAPYTYNWDNGITSSQNNQLFGGSHTVTVTDALGATATKAFFTSGPTTFISPSLTTTHQVSCNGGSDGSASALATGGTPPYNYTWSGSAQSGGSGGWTYNNLSAGTYTITVTDAYGCTVTSGTIITEPAAISISYQPTNITCNGGNNGSIDITVSGGTAPYTFFWSSNNIVTEDLTNLAAGVYTVTVTDANNCSTSLSITLTEPPPIVMAAQVMPVMGCSNALSCISMSSNACQPMYECLTAQFINNTACSVQAGVYTVSVMDCNGCTATKVLVVQPIQMPMLSLSMPSSNVSCDGDVQHLTATASGGLAPYTYTWDTGEQDNYLPFTVASANFGTHTITITDSQGCTISTSVVVNPINSSHSLDCVFPGDANDDGVANNYDLLPIALYHDTTGFARTNPTTQWTAQTCQDWAQLLQNTTTNLKHTDCDGNGSITASDTLAILQNYGQTHQRAAVQIFINAPPISCAFPSDTTQVTSYPYTLTADVMIGNAANPAQAITGVAFTIDYDGTLADSAYINLNSLSWLGAANELYHLQHDDGQGHLDIAISRIDGTTRNGFGAVATCGFVIIDNVIGRGVSTINYPFNVSISGIKAIDNQNIVQAMTGTATTTTFTNMLLNTPEIGLDSKIRVFPNPLSSTILHINSDNIKCHAITILNGLGQCVFTQKTFEKENLTLTLPTLSAGVYFMEIDSSEGKIMKKLVVNQTN